MKCRDNNHTYDISKKGYINLFNGQTKIVKTYDRKLFSARKITSDTGLYAGLTEKICEVINKIDNKNPRAVLDAGCGCGNLTFDIFRKTGKTMMFAVDLSKDGIDFAAASFCEDNLLWIVGNLNNLPLSENKFDVILNIMSPANYLEFKRVLKHDGVLLKVLPDSDYLKELRHFIYGENDKNEYSNKDVLTNLEENINITDIIDIRYTHAVKSSDIPALFDMTPLTLNINERERTKAELTGSLCETGDFEVTLAFKIAVCGKFIY
ncbi:MAG: methyltransferase domain-containing protein [Oscillospiraceae bacterium]|nr:methyltransferase domain-containing protein [Oscillospiraceae bacterium]